MNIAYSEKGTKPFSLLSKNPGIKCKGCLMLGSWYCPSPMRWKLSRPLLLWKLCLLIPLLALLAWTFHLGLIYLRIFPFSDLVISFFTALSNSIDSLHLFRCVNFNWSWKTLWSLNNSGNSFLTSSRSKLLSWFWIRLFTSCLLLIDIQSFLRLIRLVWIDTPRPLAKPVRRTIFQKPKRRYWDADFLYFALFFFTCSWTIYQKPVVSGHMNFSDCSKGSKIYFWNSRVLKTQLGDCQSIIDPNQFSGHSYRMEGFSFTKSGAVFFGMSACWPGKILLKNISKFAIERIRFLRTTGKMFFFFQKKHVFFSKKDSQNR